MICTISRDMPSQLHEALLILFRNRPQLAPELLRDALHVELPLYSEVRIESAQLTDIQPAEYRADLVARPLDTHAIGPRGTAGTRATITRTTSSGCPSTALSNQIRSDTLAAMKTLSATVVARNFSAVLDALELDQEEVVLVRNRRHIARLVPEAQRQDAMEVFGDLYRTLDDKTADAVSSSISANRKSRRGRVSELKNPWVG